MAEVRFIIDVSMLIRAGGTATGISRVSRELSEWALANCPNARLATLDWLYSNEVLRLLDNHVAPSLLDKTAVIDTFLIPDRFRADKIRIREYLPIPLRFVLMSIQHPRRAILILLERWRQRTTSADLAARIGRVQDRFMTEKNLRMLSTPTGERSRLVGYYKALLPFDPKPDDILLLTGADWGSTSPELYAELKAKHGMRIVWMCYDIIPLLYPHFFKESVARDFKHYADGLLAVADVVLVSARAIQSDLVEYCKQAGLRQPETRIVPFGADLTQSSVHPPQPLRHGLEPGRYGLFVSTIEPRKGHRMLLSVWKKLLAEGVPQAANFSLVFVGRAGWLVDDLIAEIKALNGAANLFHLLSAVDDGELHSLYRNAAFCLYPSFYEGYGLPVVEAFGYGKAVLASNGGALKEVVGRFSPSLDPLDEDAWYVAIKRWIEHPEDRLPYESAIRESYRHPTWDAAARACFAAVEDALADPSRRMQALPDRPHPKRIA